MSKIVELTADGLVVKSTDEIVTQLEEGFKSALGNRVKLTTKSIVKVFVGVVSDRLREVVEAIQATNDARNRNNATGTALDDMGDELGLTRLDATNSRVEVVLAGTDGTSIAAGKKIRVPNNTETFETEAVVVIGETFKKRITLSAELIAANQFDATVNASAISVVYATSHAATLTAIAAAIDALANVTAAVVSDVDGLTIEVTGTTLPTITGAAVTLGASQATVAITVVVHAFVSATDTGVIQGAAGALTEIVTPVGGWDTVTNDGAAALGRDIETDAAYRIRQEDTLANVGAGTVESIRSQVSELSYVNNCSVVENATDATVDSRLPHSIEVIADVGSAPTSDQLQAIADLLWTIKPGGIQYVSTGTTVTKTVVDSEGNNQTIVFSRPVLDSIYVDIAVTTDTDYPADGDTQLKAAVLAYGDALAVGADVLNWKAEAACNAVPGITVLDITMKVGSAPGVGDTGNIVIAANHRASFAIANMTVS